MINTCLPKVEQAVVNLAPDLADALLQLADIADRLLVDFVQQYGLNPGNENTAITLLNDSIRDLQTAIQELANNTDDPLDNLVLVAILNQTILDNSGDPLLAGPATLPSGAPATAPFPSRTFNGDPDLGPLINEIGDLVGVDPSILTALTQLTESPIREYVSETIDNPIVPGGDIIDRTLSEIENNTDCVALNAIAQSNLEAIAELIEDITEHCGELAGSGAPGGGCDPLPLGLIIPYGGTPAVDTPKCYLPCDGASYSTTGDYKALFEVIGYNFGGSGDTFKVPDMRSRFPLGVSSSEVKEDDEYVNTEDLVTDAAAATLGGKGGREKRGISVQKDAFEASTLLGNFIKANKDLAGTEILLTGTAQFETSVDSEEVLMKGTDRQIATIKFVKTADDINWDEDDSESDVDEAFVKVAKEIKTLPPYLAVHYVIKAKK